jgi:hypothetical protein
VRGYDWLGEQEERYHRVLSDAVVGKAGEF